METIAVLSAILTASAVVIGVIQWQIMEAQREIMNDQTALMSDQLKLMTRQDQIIEEQLRHVELEVMYNLTSYDQQTGRVLISVSAHNIGPKAVRDFYWHAGVPEEFFVGNSFMMNGSTLPVEPLMNNDIRYQLAKGFCERPLYPTRQLVLCTLTLVNITPATLVTLASKFVHEDGTDPQGEQYATETIDIGSHFPPA